MAAEHETLRQGPPDRELALVQYSGHADHYDEQTDFAAGDRARVVSLLRLGPGDAVVDVGCGTGLCFEHILAGVGADGRLTGIDPSPEMLARARQRVKRRRWDNVGLVLAAAEDAAIDGPADAALFCFTHDVVRSLRALENILGQLRPGARVAAVGPMWAPWWAPAVNWTIWYVASQYVTTFEGFSEPWTRLAALVPDLSVEPRALAGVYFASGTWPG